MVVSFEKMKSHVRLGLGISMAAVAWTASAKTCYVDCNRPDNTGDGESEATAFRTIQAAVDKCQADRNFKEVVVLPGVYKEGLSTADGNGRSRVYINGNDNGFVITLRSRDGAATTAIEGAYDPESDCYGMGPNAIRCLTVRGGCNSRIIGFTLRNGATAGTLASRSDGFTVRGGAVMGTGSANSCTLVDCVITNNAGTRGGALYGCTAVRCRIADNIGSNYGAAARESALYHCLLARNRIVLGDNGVGTVAYPFAIVNCTFCDNDGFCLAQMTSSNAYGPIYNSILLNASGWGDAESRKNLGKLHNCATVADEPVTSGEACVKVDYTDLFSPITCDYRVCTNSASAGTGNASHLVNVPADYRHLTLDGVTLPTSGAIDPGCFGVRACPATAKVIFAVDNSQGRYTLNDRPITNVLHYASETWPVTFRYEATPKADSQAVTRYWLYKDETLTITALPFNPDGKSVSMLMPPPDGHVYRISPVYGGKLFVDDDAVAEGADGSAAKPYPTIQQAADAALTLRECCIYVAPGHYNRGETYALDASNRVTVANHSGFAITLRSTGGKEVTFIEGKSDPATIDDPQYRGCGTNACRCLTVEGGTTLVQGFTFIGGRGFVSADNSDKNNVHGGGVHGTTTATIMDCDIVDCNASRGGGAYSGTYVRCVFRNCRSFSNGVTRNCTVRGCLFIGNGGNDIVGNGTTAFQTTAVCNTNATGANTFHYYMNPSYGLVAGDNIGADARNTTEQPFYHSVLGYVSAATLPKLPPSTVGNQNPLFVDAAHGDCRVYSCSPAAHRLDPAAFDWTAFLCEDIDGNPFRFNADGTTVAGAFAEVVPSVFVSSDYDNGVSPAGLVPVSAEGSIPLTAMVDRPVVAWEVNGERVACTDHEYALPVSLLAANGDVFSAQVKPVYGNVWYVDAEKGSDDDNNGYAADDAKRTLAAILAKANQTGDVVKAAPGDYKTDTMNSVSVTLNGVRANVIARAAISAGVTLEATAGADVTFITGEGDWTTDPVNGLGPNAVRCVSMAPNARLRGFTLRDGHADDGSERAESCGGGVLCDGSTPLVENCVITNCCATRGGGVRYGTYVNCRFLDNGANANAPAARAAELYGCFLDGNRQLNGNNFGVVYSCRLENCTVGPNNRNTNNSPLYSCFSNSKGSCDQVVLNSLLCGANGTWGGAYTNCVLPVGKTPGGAAAGELWGFADLIYGDVTIDAKGVPAKSCAAVDAANPALDTRAVGATDLYGRQRVWNVTRDIGCCDYDWRGDFAATLRPSKLEVSLAEPNVTATENAVKILSGRLDAVWTRSSTRKPPCRFRCTVKGTGSLVVTLNGETFATLTAADGECWLEFRNALAENALSFAYTADAEDALGAEIANFETLAGSAIYFR